MPKNRKGFHGEFWLEFSLSENDISFFKQTLVLPPLLFDKPIALLGVFKGYSKKDLGIFNGLWLSKNHEIKVMQYLNKKENVKFL